jgi:hypothetical protein
MESYKLPKKFQDLKEAQWDTREHTWNKTKWNQGNNTQNYSLYKEIEAAKKKPNEQTNSRATDIMKE